MRPRPDDRGDLTQVATELWELGTAYAKQETIDPIKGLSQFLRYGVSGAVLLSIGFAMLMLAALRALQTETGTTFTGNLSWIPYLIVLVVGVLVIVVAVARITTRKGSDP